MGTLVNKRQGYGGYKPGEHIEKGARASRSIDSPSRRGVGKKDQYGLKSTPRYRPKNR